MGLTAVIGSPPSGCYRLSLVAANRKQVLRDHGALPVFTGEDADSRPAPTQCSPVQRLVVLAGALSLHCSNAVPYRVRELTRRTRRRNLPKNQRGCRDTRMACGCVTTKAMFSSA